MIDNRSRHDDASSATDVHLSTQFDIVVVITFCEYLGNCKKSTIKLLKMMTLTTHMKMKVTMVVVSLEVNNVQKC
jgi:hypothetical protein